MQNLGGVWGGAGGEAQTRWIMGDVQRVKKVMGERGINSKKLLQALWLKKPDVLWVDIENIHVPEVCCVVRSLREEGRRVFSFIKNKMILLS